MSKKRVLVIMDNPSVKSERFLSVLGENGIAPDIVPTLEEAKKKFPFLVDYRAIIMDTYFPTKRRTELSNLASRDFLKNLEETDNVPPILLDTWELHPQASNIITARIFPFQLDDELKSFLNRI